MKHTYILQKHVHLLPNGLFDDWLWCYVYAQTISLGVLGFNFFWQSSLSFQKKISMSCHHICHKVSLSRNIFQRLREKGIMNISTSPLYLKPNVYIFLSLLEHVVPMMVVIVCVCYTRDNDPCKLNDFVVWVGDKCRFYWAECHN